MATQLVGQTFTMASHTPVNPYKAYAVSADGTMKPIEGQRILIELEPDQIIESDLAPHPNHRGRLPISTDTQNDHRGTHYSSLTIRPGAGNVIHLSVERHQTTPNQSVQSNQ